MSYSGGVFSINTSGQPVVSNTTISAATFNALTADLATGLSTCMLKDGTQTATAGIGFFAGTVSLPGIYFGTDTATGFYRIAINNTGFAINGTKLLDLSAGAVVIAGSLSLGANALTAGTITAVDSIAISGNRVVQGDGVNAFWAINGINVGSTTTNTRLYNSSSGAGSATLYIGNASINVTSDARLKKNIQTLNSGLDVVMALRPVEFDQDELRPIGDIQHYAGFIAQEAHKVAPWSVNTQGDTDQPWQMRYEFLMAPVVRAIQEHELRMRELEAKLQ